MTRVVLAAHGTHDPAGIRVVEGLLAAVRDRLAGTRVAMGWLSVAEPMLPEVLAAEPTDVVVPLLLGSGYHVLVDIPQMVGEAAAGARVSAHLGPDRLVVRAVADRIRTVDPAPIAVVLAAAGTSHPVGRSEARQAADMLSALLDAPVGVAYASGQGPDVASAVARFTGTGASRVTVAPYLLAPGMFADRIRTTAIEAGAECAEVLGDHPAVVDLVLQRVGEALGRAGREDRLPGAEDAA